MKKIKFEKKSILSIVLIVAILIASLGLISSLISVANRTTIKSSAFSRGSLNSSGKYVETNQSIYTKEAFGCMGLRIEPDFEFEGTYDVFYYDYNDNLIESKIGLDTIYDEDYPLAMMARIAIHPDIPQGENAKEYKIKWYDVSGIANMFNITVNNNQEWIYESDNLFDKNSVTMNTTFGYPMDNDGNFIDRNVIQISGSPVYKLSEYIPVSYKNYDVYVRCNSDDENWTGAVVIASENDMKVIAAEHVNMEHHRPDEWVKITVSISGEVLNTYKLIVKMPNQADCYIFGYN